MPYRLYEDGTLISYARSPGGRPPGGHVNGNKRKHFLLTSKHKRLIRSSAIRQGLTAKYKLLFCTLTFPGDISQREANKCFSNFTDNLKTNFKLNSYVAVKENTQRGRPHFHCLFDIPFTDFKVLNKAWNSAFDHLFDFSRNAFTTGRNPIIQNIGHVIGYITKYITKTVKAQTDVKPETRQYFISQNVHSSPALLSEDDFFFLMFKRKYEKFESEFFTWYRLDGFADLPEKYQLNYDAPRKRKRNKVRQFSEKTGIINFEFDKNNGFTVDFHYNS